MSILITNDDGYRSPGIRALHDALIGLDELWLSAPAEERSGVSHAFTMNKPIRVNAVEWVAGNRGFSVHGMPADTVKLALSTLMDKPADYVVSGINAGENSGVDLLYSGTVAAAMEANIMGINAIAFSMASKSYEDYSFAARFARILTGMMLEHGLPPGIMLNVNFPPVPESEIKGVRITTQAESRYEQVIKSEVINEPELAYHVDYKKTIFGDTTNCDYLAIRDNYVSVTPIHARWTDLNMIPIIENWDIEAEL